MKKFFLGIVLPFCMGCSVPTASTVAKQHLTDAVSVAKIYLVTNHLGSVVLTFDRNGSVSSRTHYDPYGKVVSAGGYPNDSKNFIAKDLNRRTNLVQMGAREYDPNLGVFTQIDIMPF